MGRHEPASPCANPVLVPLLASIRDPRLRAAQLSFVLAWIAEWAFTVAIGVVAYQDAGALGVGMVGLLRMLPAAVVAPFVAPLADRVRRERFLVGIALARTAAFAAIAGFVATGTAAVYVVAVVAAVAGTLFRPVHSALLPSLCGSARELSAANVSRGLLDSVATFVGPLLATLLLGPAQLPAVFGAAAACSVLSGVALLRLRIPALVSRRPAADTRVGLGAVVRNRPLALLFGLTAVQTATRGAVSVLLVVVAIDLLRIGDAGVGLLTTAIGAGAVVGSLGASLLSGSARLAVWFGVGTALWGAPLVLVGAIPSVGTTLAMLACVGVGNALVDVGLFTLPPRLVPDGVLARAFTILESVIALSVGVGAVVAPLLIDVLGVRAALIVVGVVAPVVVLLSWARLRALDSAMAERDQRIATLVGTRLDLPMTAIERIARELEGSVGAPAATIAS